MSSLLGNNIMNYEIVHKQVLNYNDDTYDLLGDDDNDNDNNFFNTTDNTTVITTDNTTVNTTDNNANNNTDKNNKILRTLICNYKHKYDEILTIIKEKYNIPTNFMSLINNCQISFTTVLTTNIYKSNKQLFEIIKKTINYKTENNKQIMDTYIDNIMSIIYFYNSNRRFILEMYKYTYNMLFIKIIDIYCKNIKQK
jgi:hypothetical protein